MNIAYTCNDKYFDGLYLSILSIVRREKESINFYIITGDFSYINPKYISITKEHEDKLKELVKKYKKSITFIDGKPIYDKYLKNNKNEKSTYSPHSLLRLVLDKIDTLPDKILYLDSDIMANKSIKELYDIDVSNYDFAINHDWLSRYWRIFRPNYINSGVILFNIKRIKKSNFMQRCRDYLYKKKTQLPDQTAMYKCANNFIFFPSGFIYNNQSGKIHQDTVLMHFCKRIKGWPLNNNIKQWNIDKVHKILKIFNFDEDYKIYLKSLNK